jgi:hypothetical protein
MNNDGWGQVGAGPSDRRMVGDDLQHYAQDRTADERPTQHRVVIHSSEDGGPMKHHELSDHSYKSMRQHVEDEKKRHEEAMSHHRHHLERHHKRNNNSQHGHDDYKY